MASKIQQLNEMVAGHNGRLIARNDQDTEAAFRFATSRIARNFARRTAELGATSKQWPHSPNTVTVTIR